MMVMARSMTHLTLTSPRSSPHAPYLLALDQGTSSSRSVLFNRQGEIVAMAQQELPALYPQPGWVEQDPMQIWGSQLATARQVLREAGISAQQIGAMGITSQRETSMLWHRKTGYPLHNALVWQDRRTEPLCQSLREQGLAPTVQAKTGLLIDAYFSATKIKWLLDQVPGARAMADRHELAFGTVDSWLLWQLTGGTVHATDVSNAARTLLFDIHHNRWDPELLAALDIPVSLLPEVRPSSHLFGMSLPDWLGHAVPIGAMAGDQQSALFGQGCFQPGMAKNTYGTGCFLLMHTGTQASTSNNGLLCTRTVQTQQAAPEYALEGSVFVGGAVVHWLRDGLKAIQSSAEVQALAQSVPDAGGVMMVPAFTGLGAPYWNPEARGTLTGLTRGTHLGHIARAALDSIALQSTALLQAMNRDVSRHGGSSVHELRVDGGACANDLLMQTQADLLGIPVVRPTVIETTALGAAQLAGLTLGVYSGLEELQNQRRIDRCFEPQISRDQAQATLTRWEHAIRQTTAA
jgi:glycerol kinase